MVGFPTNLDVFLTPRKDFDLPEGGVRRSD